MHALHFFSVLSPHLPYFPGGSQMTRASERGKACATEFFKNAPTWLGKELENLPILTERIGFMKVNTLGGTVYSG